MEPNQNGKPNYVRTVIIVSTLLPLALIGVFIAIWMLWGVSWGNLNLGKTLLAAFVVGTFAFGLRVETLNPTEVGALDILGIYLPIRNPGPVLELRGVMRLIKETKNVIQLELPGETPTEKKGRSVHWGSVQKILITHASRETADYQWDKQPDDAEGRNKYEDDPLHQRMTTTVKIIVRYRIDPNDYIQFLKTIGTLADADQQIEDTVIATAQRVMGKRTPAQVINHYKKVNELLLNAVEVLVGEKTFNEEVPDGNVQNAPTSTTPAGEPSGEATRNEPWAIRIVSVQLKLPDVGELVKESMEGAVEAQYKKRSTITEAEANRVKKELEGQGDAKARQLLLEAEAIGIEKLATQTGTDAGKLSLWAQTLRETLGNANYSVLSTDSPLINAAAGIQETLKKLGSTQSGGEK